MNSLYLLFFVFSPALMLACPASDPLCLESLFNLSAVADAFLGDHGTVIFQNGLLGNSTNACAALSVVFARGTTEPAGYLNGTTKLAIQGVDYPADIAGFLAGGSFIGTTAMAALINHTLATCPDTLLTLSGYSQGAQVVHLATASLPANMTAKIASVVLFDPKNGTVVQGVDSKRVLSICHTRDNICKGDDEVAVAHLNYSGVATLGITSGKMKTSAGGGLG